MDQVVFLTWSPCVQLFTSSIFQLLGHIGAFSGKKVSEALTLQSTVPIFLFCVCSCLLCAHTRALVFDFWILSYPVGKTAVSGSSQACRSPRGTIPGMQWIRSLPWISATCSAFFVCLFVYDSVSSSSQDVYSDILSIYFHM